jgi:hypothetical protein
LPGTPLHSPPLVLWAGGGVRPLAQTPPPPPEGVEGNSEAL